MSPYIIQQFLVPFIAWFFLVFGIIGFVVGAGLVFNSVRMQEFFGVMNHWVSMRHSTRWLAIPLDTGPSVQRFRYLIGAVFIIAAAFSTFILVTRINISSIAAAFGVETSSSLITWIMECIRWFLIVGNILAIVVGIMLIFFPKALHAIEVRANHWYSIRSHSQGSDTMHMAIDNWVENNPGTMGWIIAIGALIVVVNFGILLFVHS